ncbi:prepilin-type N-terminal cleavage/methylation domain-containing protein [Deferribacter autotrophicus]|uniref:Prepilin-type N-terminal cleavage/methylation domain-containing protein n=2 Tax=Deferribacter autotrophicus TaxID=500465 RepID=A0A5A8F6B6_9BACT|nr:prepilin-type N-terminal cleavage/methylation domain-containing protein [Deferribacter autotrophicus]
MFMLNKKAFTLIELMIAILIFLIAILGLVPAFINAVKINKINEVRDKAYLALNKKLIEIESMDFNSLANDNGTITIDNTDYNYTINVIDDSSSIGKLKKVVVTVKWTKPYYNEENSISGTIYVRAKNE